MGSTKKLTVERQAPRYRKGHPETYPEETKIGRAAIRAAIRRRSILGEIEPNVYFVKRESRVLWFAMVAMVAMLPTHAMAMAPSILVVGDI